MKAAVALASLVFVASGCANDEAAKRVSTSRAVASPQPAADVRAALPRLARELIPDTALRSLAPGELKVEECGITPTFPCTSAFFSFAAGRGIDARIRALRALATANGWRVEELERFATGAYINLVRGQYHARYTIERALAPGGSSFVQVQVYGPQTALPRPSIAERRAWSDERRRYVRRANAICAKTLRGLTDPDDLAAVLDDLADKLASLEAPSGDEEDVQRFLRPLRNLVRAARALRDDEGEDALPAVVGVGEFTKRFVAAASAYGLTDCALG